MAEPAIPTFYLYGEPHRSVDDGFVHVERLDDRSRPSEWTIRAHSHADLHQCLLIDQGGGTVTAEDDTRSFTGPALMVVPATVVHSFAWERESAGWVLTVGGRFFGQLAARHPDLGVLFEAPRLLHPDPEAAVEIDRHMTALRRELGWASRGHEAAIEAAMLHLLVLCLRMTDSRDALAPGSAPSPAAALVARYRERLEDRFHLRERIADHAAALCVSETTLRAACASIAERSPSAMLDDRAMLEARRMLLYTNLGIAEIGYATGFDDPAYFSRFFARRAGRSPLRFRRDRTGALN